MSESDSLVRQCERVRYHLSMIMDALNRDCPADAAVQVHVAQEEFEALCEGIGVPHACKLITAEEAQ